MYDWIDAIVALLEEEGEVELELATHGVEQSVLDAAEQRLGVQLPPSYRTFLSRWDGCAHDADGHRLLSLDEVVQLATTEAPFEPMGTAPSPCGAQGYYRAKPAHWLFVMQHAFGRDGYCLELDGAAEPIARLYDAELVRWEEGRLCPSSRVRAGFEAVVAELIWGSLDGETEQLEAIGNVIRSAGRARGWSLPGLEPG